MGRRAKFTGVVPAATRGANTELSPAMKLLLGHLGGKPWGKLPQTAATWHGLASRGLTEVVDGRPPHTELTAAGRKRLALLDAEMSSRG